VKRPEKGHRTYKTLAFMRYYEEAADAEDAADAVDAADTADVVCVKNSRLCVKFMLEFTRLFQNVTI
jgi:hypothetical protein